MAKFLGWLGWLLLIAIGGAGYWVYELRADPIQWVPGRALTGDLVATPVSDWSFANEAGLIAVETRPAAPHSVTTTKVVVDGTLYVPALGASAKSWTHYVVSEPRVRVKIGEKIYPGVARRVDDPDTRTRVFSQLRARMGTSMASGPAPADVWLFRIDSPSVAAAADNEAAARAARSAAEAAKSAAAPLTTGTAPDAEGTVPAGDAAGDGAASVSGPDAAPPSRADPGAPDAAVPDASAPNAALPAITRPTSA